MAAPYLINNSSVTKGVVRNVESESGSAIVWYRERSYSFEWYEEELNDNITYSGGGTPISHDYRLYRRLSATDAGNGSGLDFLAFKNTFSKDPLLKASLQDYNWGIGDEFNPGRYQLFMSGFTSNSDSLEDGDFLVGVHAVNSIGGILTETVEPGTEFGGTGSWLRRTVTVGASGELGQGYIHFYNVTGVLDQFPSDPEIAGTGSLDKTVLIHITENTGEAAPFPVRRPTAYNPDDHWDPTVSDWTSNPADLTTLGGGRYNKQIMILGHKAIYFGGL